MWINTRLDTMTANDTLVFANNRQVLAFKKTWAVQKGTSALPETFAWHQYLQSTWRRLYPNSTHRLINAIESRALIIQSMTGLKPMIDQRLVDEVVKNNDYCYAHLINAEQLLSAHAPHSTLFNTWMQDYQHTKQQQNLLDINDLSALILRQNHKINPPYVYGFKTLTPEQSLVFNHIGYQPLNASHANTHSHNSVFLSTDAEIQSAAQWAYDLHQKHPHRHIAIVSPTLNREHHQIKSIFDQVFADTFTETGQKAYNISLGLPLTDYPLIRHLLAILKLCEQLHVNRIHTETFNAVVVSPYIKGAKIERSNRALLVNQILSIEQTHFKIERIEPFLTRTPQLKILLETLIKPTRKKQNHAQWLLHFNARLQAWGFATDRVLSSVEYQLFNKYQQASLVLNQLAQTQGNVGAAQALSDLKNSLMQVIFQAQSSKTPIQILGSLEAEGLYFDAAWVLGMTDNFLPAAFNSPKFIPASIAQQHQIPHSSFELIRTDGENTLNNLINLADKVIFSYAQTHLENQQQPSPLLVFDDTPAKTVLTRDYPSVPREFIDDSHATPLADTQVRGGVAILKDQMACAFKGFAHRLNIARYDDPHIGLSRSEQGDIIHKVLEQIYQKITTQHGLIALKTDELTALINATIQSELNHYPPSGFAQVEHARLTQLICKFIDTEKQRDEFSVIATERTIEANVNGLKFRIRLDRIDELDNGDRIIFDYKTGNLPANPWCSDAIKEPQLPIYALINHADGIGFIKPAADKISYVGLAKNHKSLPHKTAKQKSCADWATQKKHWQLRLDETSFDYQQGKAEVLPTNTACLYCPYDSLCRVEK